MSDVGLRWGWCACVRGWVGRRETVPALAGRFCRRKVLGRKSFRAVREGVGLIAFNARIGTVSLLLRCSVILGQAARELRCADSFLAPPYALRRPPG